jgi:hypothetical protein
MIIETLLSVVTRPVMTFAPTPLGLILAGVAVMGYVSKKPRLRLASLIALVAYLMA